MSARTAQVYMQIEKTQRSAYFQSREAVSIAEFLHIVRQGKRAAALEERRQAREDAARAAGAAADRRYRIYNADCRAFRRWPAQVDAIATDPPWQDRDAYRWLADFAASRLREGGIALVQAGTPDLADVLPVLTSGLNYVWTFSIVYPDPFPFKGALPFAVGWRPVLVLSKGAWRHDRLRRVSDALTVRRSGPCPKRLHDWQQPVWPWFHWLEALTRAGETVADPFVGSGTVAVATKAAGARRFVGTEVDRDNARVARGRLADAAEGSPPA